MSVWQPGPRTPRPGTPRPGTPRRGEATPDAVVFADYFDGRRALRRRVALSAGTEAGARVLLLRLPSSGTVRWPLDRIRRVPDQAGGDMRTFALDAGAPDRLVADGAARDWMAHLAPGGFPALAPRSLWRRALLVSGAGAATLAALVLVILPALAGILARFMDPEAELALGELHYEQTRALFSNGDAPLRECRGAAGRAALGALADRVSAGVALPYPLRVAVLDDRTDPILNAYAVAGGRIAFFHSMILAADAPEEIAAVLAHELGHVANSDPVRHTLQTASGMAVLSVLIGDVTGGGLLGGTAGAALASGYSRKAEARADAFAHDRLIAAGLPPSALGTMFQRLRDEYGEVEGLVAHFASHPQLAARIARAGRAGDPATGAPALTPAEWTALRGICG